MEDREEDDTNISEKYKCYVPGQCQVWLCYTCSNTREVSNLSHISGIFYQLQNERWCRWLPEVLWAKWGLQLVVLWARTESLCLVHKLHRIGRTRQSRLSRLHQWWKAVSKYTSNEIGLNEQDILGHSHLLARMQVYMKHVGCVISAHLFICSLASILIHFRCPPRTCHGAFKCKGIFIDSFAIEHLEDCIGACNDNDVCKLMCRFSIRVRLFPIRYWLFYMRYIMF